MPFWIDIPFSGRLATMPRPRGGTELNGEIGSLRQEGVDRVVSLLSQAEIAELGLEREPDICETENIRFTSFPMNDRAVPPSFSEFRALCEAIAADLGNGQAVAIHCRFGIGRASLLAASVLVQMGMTPDLAFERIRKARGVYVPDTEQQRTFVKEYERYLETGHDRQTGGF